MQRRERFKNPNAEGLMSTIESSVWEDDRALPFSYRGDDAKVRAWLKKLEAEAKTPPHPVGRCADRDCACQPRHLLGK